MYVYVFSLPIFCQLGVRISLAVLLLCTLTDHMSAEQRKTHGERESHKEQQNSSADLYRSSGHNISRFTAQHSH